MLMEKKKESRSGMEIMNLLQVFVVGRINRTERISSPFFLVMIFMICVCTERRAAAWDLEWEEG